VTTVRATEDGTVRDDTPLANDFGLVVRMVGAPTPTGADIVTYPDVLVGAVAVIVIAANPTRKKAIVQNVGTVNLRVGDLNITATRGIRLTPNSVLVYDQPFCPLGDIFCISEGANTEAGVEEIA